MVKCGKYMGLSGQFENLRPFDNDIVTVKTSGNITEIKHSQTKSKGGTTRKVSKTEYIDTRTGELKLFNPQSKRTDDLISIYRTIANGRDIIRANCTKPECCLFITLTYAKNMTDNKKLVNDYKNFLKRLPKNIKPQKWISAVEPQRRGAWHIHALFVYENKAPFVENSIIAGAWKQGFVQVKSVDNCDDVGAYLCAYLTDIEISNDSAENNQGIKVVTDEKGLSKRIKKGGRLYMYPAGMHIFRWSQNCVKPYTQKMRSREANALVHNQALVYEKTSVIEDEETNFKNIINTRVYNKARKAKE